MEGVMMYLFDGTMCRSEKCPWKYDCHRYTATPQRIQSYFIGGPTSDYNNCEYYWDNRLYEDEVRKDRKT